MVLIGGDYEIFTNVCFCFFNNYIGNNIPNANSFGVLVVVGAKLNYKGVI